MSDNKGAEQELARIVLNTISQIILEFNDDYQGCCAEYGDRYCRKRIRDGLLNPLIEFAKQQKERGDKLEKELKIKAQETKDYHVWGIGLKEKVRELEYALIPANAWGDIWQVIAPSEADQLKELGYRIIKEPKGGQDG